MIQISAENINRTSPYQVKTLDELSVSFVTDYGISYDIGFYEDRLFNMPEAYHFYISNANKQHAQNDPKVLQTVMAVIEEFFRQDPLVMLYICDPRDHRQAARNRLYRQWFENYSNNCHFRLYSESVVYKSVAYYAGLIMRNDNPYYDEVVAAFHDIVGYLPEQMVGNKT
ncbi:MAG: hypothetical protein IK073_06650 [Paludibacteraceae bacterium]|nr:hypothetical protein [Paludibacteraceae bacterium]